MISTPRLCDTPSSPQEHVPYESRSFRNESTLKTFTPPLLPSATKLRRLCFYRHVSVHRGGGAGLSASVHGGIHPPEQTPLESRHPPEQTPPLERRPLLRTVRILLECILVKRISTYCRLLAVFEECFSLQATLACVLCHVQVFGYIFFLKIPERLLILSVTWFPCNITIQNSATNKLGLFTVSISTNWGPVTKRIKHTHLHQRGTRH